MAIIKKNKKNHTERKLNAKEVTRRKARDQDVVTQSKSTVSVQASPDELRKMFQVYMQSNGNLAAVSKATGVHRKTVRKYKELYEWDAQRQKAVTILHEREVELEVDRRQRNLHTLDMGIENIKTQLVADKDGVITNVPMKILPSLIKAQHELLEGSPETTPPITPELRSALTILDALGKDTLKGIADHMAKINFQVTPLEIQTS